MVEVVVHDSPEEAGRSHNLEAGEKRCIAEIVVGSRVAGSACTAADFAAEIVRTAVGSGRMAADCCCCMSYEERGEAAVEVASAGQDGEGEAVVWPDSLEEVWRRIVGLNLSRGVAAVVVVVEVD